ncbi:NAD(P)-binding protein [Melanogaster broomeanus]|nr:NAD(P)-binding protein [Melanogaster broomeanus]
MTRNADTVARVLVTGSSVVATLRNPDALADLAAKYPTSQLVVVKLDVTHSSDVSAAFEKARQAFGRIDVVFNNAGQALMGEVEGVPEEVARSVFEVNFWGAANVTKEAVRFFRDVNTPAGGRLLQLSSQGGIVGAPAVGFYSASECLSKELDPAWNIKAGPCRTKIMSENMKISPQHPAYADPKSPSSQLRAFFSPESNSITGDADKAIAAMEKLVHLDNPPLRLALHKRTVEAYESWSDDLYIN